MCGIRLRTLNRCGIRSRLKVHGDLVLYDSSEGEIARLPNMVRVSIFCGFCEVFSILTFN